MGDPSSFRFVPASVANIPIDWTRVPEESKKQLLEGWGHDWEKEEERPLPTTIADLAKFFDESKFFGYFGPSLCTLLMDISEFGLQSSPGQARVGPRFYMKYLQQVWYLLFAPGTRDCIVGYSDDTPFDDSFGEDEEGDKRMMAGEIELAQKFDTSLEQEVLVGRAQALLVGFSSKLGGWHAETLEASMHTAQLGQAMLILPRDHPARQLFLSMMFGR